MTPRRPSKSETIRTGSTRVRVPNSGLEVWLYDDAHLQEIRKPTGRDKGFGGMPPQFEKRTKAGLVVGYNLLQDDEIDVAVIVGDALTEKERSVARWLEPQTAYLRVPSGKLCIESNDASRLGPEKPGAKGAVVQVPAGDYRVTLYRVDHEALDREGLGWSGPQEVIVLTPGGSKSDAAERLLAFEPRRDNTWIGQYKLGDKSADVLVWFGDYWDTFVVNLDGAAASKLNLQHGAYIRTHVPRAGITLLTAFAKSWEDARRLPLPSAADPGEYGYAAFSPMSDWNGAEALFCRRDTSKTKVEDQFQNIWLPGTIEIEPPAANAPAQGPAGLVPTDLRANGDFDSGFLAMVLSDVLPEVEDLDELEWPDALKMFDAKLNKLGLAPVGDLSWQEQIGPRTLELGFRLYAGAADCFAALLVGQGFIQVFFLTETLDGKWIATGLMDDLERFIRRKGPDGLPVPNPLVQMESKDEALPKIFKAHAAMLKKATAGKRTPPADRDDAAGAFQRFLAAAFGSSGNPAA